MQTTYSDEERESLITSNNPQLTTPKTPVKPPKKRNLKWIQSIVIVIITLAALIGVLLVAFYSSPHYAARTDDFIRPLTDQREYENFILSNGLKVLVISDPHATSSAAALSIGAGSFSDPRSIAGLAHFAEHLVFMGSEKYPELDGFSKYISNYGGSSNAFTASEETNFFFRVAPSGFETSLDMFLHMFVSPIFSNEWVQSEIAAVDGEYNIDLQSDSWRTLFALQSAANPKSPYSKFSIGNTDTLINKPEQAGVDIIDALQNFFESYYSSNIMSLVVLHNGAISDLQDLVMKQFSFVENRHTKLPSIKHSQKPFVDEYAQSLIQLLPVGTDRSASLIFCVDGSLPYTKNNPLDYIYVLLNYGGPGGLSSIFKKRGWALDFSAGSSARQSFFELPEISISLTAAGVDNLSEIVRMVLAYVKLISTQGLTQEMFDQFARTSKYIFDYDQYPDDSYDSMNEVSQIASNLQHFPIHYVLSGDQMLYKFNQDLTSRFLNQLNSENLVVVVADPTFEVAESQGYNIFVQKTSHFLQKQDTTTTGTAAQTTTTDTTDSEVSDTLAANAASAPSATSGASAASDSSASTDASHITTANALSDSSDSGSDSTDTETNSNLELMSLNRYNALYNLNYSINNFPSGFLESLSFVTQANYSEFKLPITNTYIPTTFSTVNADCIGAACITALASDRSNTVKQTLKNSNTIVRHLMERSFGVPFTTCYIKLNTANLQSNVNYIAASGLVGNLVNLILTDELYEIRSAGHTVDFDPRYIKIETFSDKFTQVLQTVLQQYKQTSYNQSLFSNAQGKYVSDLNQKLLDRPYLLASEILKQFLLKRSYTILDVKNAANAFTLQNFTTILQSVQSSAQIETFLYGNLVADQSVTYGNQIVTLLGYQPYDETQLTTESVLNIQGKNLVYRLQTPVLKGSLSVTLNYYQAGKLTIEDVTYVKILVALLKQEAFTYLRTQQQLGYVASLVDDMTKNVIGLKVIVVSSSFDPNKIDLEIENFWQVAANVLTSLTDATLADTVNSFKLGLTYDSKSYRIKGNYLYNRISNQDYTFDLREKIIAYLPNVTKEKLLSRFQAIFKSPNKFSIQLYSQDQAAIGNDELLAASSEYSNTQPTLITGQADLSSYPTYTSS